MRFMMLPNKDLIFSATDLELSAFFGVTIFEAKAQETKTMF